MTDTPEVPEGLRPANENPWYILMTLYGEQEGEEIDWELHEKNRRAWNAWAGQGLDDKTKWDVARKYFNGNNSEINGWSSHQVQIQRDFKTRAKSLALPHPKDPVDLSQIEIDGHLVLVAMIVGSDLKLKEAKVARDVCGERSALFGNFDLSKAVIEGNTCWNGMFVERQITSAQTTFSGNVEVKSATFTGDVNLSQAVFKEVNDRNARVDFGGSKFGGNLRLRGMEVQGSLSFGDCDVAGRVEAEKLLVKGEFLCNSTVFRGRVTFNEAEFHGNPVTFFGSDFHQPVDLRKVSFQTTYPDFTSSLLHDRMSFTTRMQSSQDATDTGKSPYGQIYWPETPRQNPEAARQSCATIRHLLTQQGLPEEAHFFFRREMRFASQIGSFWQRLPYRSFGWLSDFGYSIQRPLWWLAGIWFLGMAAFWTVFSFPGGPPVLSESDLGTAAALSFSNLFPLFGFGRVFLSEVLAGLPRWAQVLSGAQTVLSLPLLFFLGLALRQRFRLR